MKVAVEVLRGLGFPVSSAYISEGKMYAVSGMKYFHAKNGLRGYAPRLMVSKDGERWVENNRFNGAYNQLLHVGSRSQILIGLDDKLLLGRESSSFREVLRTRRTDNVFWHIAEDEEGFLYIQEYGEPSTALYRSDDGGYTWRCLLYSRDVDPKSRHFHNVVYDPYRKMLIATLGDNVLVKAIASWDKGETWRPIHKGSYQLQSIVALEDHVVFGTDSSMSSGIVIWTPALDKWRTIHMGAFGDNVVKDNARAFDLKHGPDGTWWWADEKGALLTSNNLADWQINAYTSLYVELSNIDTSGTFIVASSPQNGWIAKSDLQITPYASNRRGRGVYIRRAKAFAHLLVQYSRFYLAQ